MNAWILMLQRVGKVRQGGGSRFLAGLDARFGMTTVWGLKAFEAVVRTASVPVFQLGPEFGQGAEFWAIADEDGDLIFQGVGVVGGRAYVLDVIE
jgi:hypothetical protein